MIDNTGAEFMRKTRYPHISPSPQSLGIPQPTLEAEPPAGAELIVLPAPESLPAYPIDLRQVIEQRRSLRAYADTHLTLAEFTFLVWCTAGVQEVFPNRTLRTVASAGARHSLDTYILVNRVEGLAPGLYRYYALRHALCAVTLDESINARLTTACRMQPQVRESAATFFWVGVQERMYWRYVERGYRYIHLDAGHICQNLYLAAEAINCGVCAIAAFDDDLVNEAIGVDGETEFIVYLASLGKRKSQPAA